ncbi:G-box-binding factor 1-like [Corylus avellana]|uniref:G-box-binding factor 1-like n=1 Tax=Corylus avellana TaxID=13451 RepID=UPI00286C5E2E|nr:G-box-binding factor 1-like [Corylus avellana]
MGIGEESKPPNPCKPASSAQYCPRATQPPFFASTVASTTPQPYLSRSQHLLIPPYRTPVPCPGLLPRWGVYTHPNMTTTPNPLHVNVELEGKGPNENDRVCTKKSMGTPGSAGNDGASHCFSYFLVNSVDSGNEGTLDAIEKNNEKQDSYGRKEGANAQSHTIGAIGEASMPPASLPLVMGSESVMTEQLMQPKPTLPTVTVTDLAVTVGGGTNHFYKKLVNLPTLPTLERKQKIPTVTDRNQPTRSPNE